METNNINTMKTYELGKSYVINVKNYNDAVSAAERLVRELESAYTQDNEFAHAYYYVKTCREIRVHMQYSDMYACDDIKINILFAEGQDVAQQKLDERESQYREENPYICELFNF